MTSHRAIRAFWAWAGLALAMLAPEWAWARQRNNDAPPPSATILSVTDLPDKASGKRGGATRRRRVAGRKKAVASGLTLAQRRKQRIIAQQKARQIALANRRALALKNQQALLNKARDAQAKTLQITQKANQKKTEIAQKTVPPVLDSSALKNTPPGNAPPAAKNNGSPAPAVGKTEVAKGENAASPQANPAPKTEVKSSLTGGAPPTVAANAPPSANKPVAGQPEAGKPVAGQPQANKPVEGAAAAKTAETKAAAPPALNDSLFKNTRADFAQPRDNAPVTGGNLLQNALALLFVAVLILGGVNIMRRQMQKGDTPLARQLAKQSAAPTEKPSGFSGLFARAAAKRAAPSPDANIRLIESLSTGNNTFIHLVEVQGKQFVVGATPWQLSMLTEIQEGAESDPGFIDALRSASVELDKLGLLDSPDSKLGMAALDSRLHDAKEAVVHNTERIRALRDQARRS